MELVRANEIVVLFETVGPNETVKGPFIFYKVGATGGIKGGHAKKIGLKWGAWWLEIILPVRGGHSKNYPKML